MPVEQWSDDVVLVHLSDDPAFTEDMESLQRTFVQKKTHAVLDFAAVKYLTSSNLAKLLRLRKQATERGTRVLFCSVGNQIWSTFMTTGLDKIFSFAENVPNALASLQIR